MKLDAIYDSRVHDGTLRPDPGQRALLPKLEEIREWLESHPDRPRTGLRGLFARPAQPPKGLYVWGGVGRGKSMLMDLFHENLAISSKRRVHFHAFMQEVQHGIHAARKRGVEDPIEPVAAQICVAVRCLCFDELQISDITDAMIVGRLFDLLFSDGVVIICTSNRPPHDLYKDGLNRAAFLPFIDLIQQRMDVVCLESPTDYRQHRLEGAQVYFSPASREAKTQIAAIWMDLTGGATGSSLQLGVNGRTIELPSFSNGVGRASFWDLCGAALGPADYLAIASAIRVLILEDIPQLSASNYNEAKRFVTLVDALYEARVRLICSAADIPERLYIEGAGAFEFERTASRLREMQSSDWSA
jgi:cell division protein ZapE